MQAFPFELKVQKTLLNFDGMTMEGYILKSEKPDHLYVLSHPAGWTFRNTESAIAIGSSRIPSANIALTFQNAFQSNRTDDLRNEILADAGGEEVQFAKGEIQFKSFKWRSRPDWVGYEVLFDYQKTGKTSTRGAVYFQVNDKEVVCIKFTVPVGAGEETLNGAKEVLGSSVEYSQDKYDKLFKQK